ncbi:MAG: hypothetical protein Q6J18_05345, partial [Gloeomargarita sp. DG02_3_bins_56]
EFRIAVAGAPPPPLVLAQFGILARTFSTGSNQYDVFIKKSYNKLPGNPDIALYLLMPETLFL